MNGVQEPVRPSAKGQLDCEQTNCKLGGFWTRHGPEGDIGTIGVIVGPGRRQGKFSDWGSGSVPVKVEVTEAHPASKRRGQTLLDGRAFVPLIEGSNALVGHCWRGVRLSVGVSGRVQAFGGTGLKGWIWCSSLAGSLN